MAFIDTSKKPYVQDRDELIFIGIELPFRRSIGVEGWFASTSTTIDAVKTNIRQLLLTERGERFFQPSLGLGLRKFLFEQMTSDSKIAIQNEIVQTFNKWLPFVEIKNIEVLSLDNKTSEKNTFSITVDFNITKDPNTLESVQVEII